jgi:hypothetical protein
MQMASSSTPYLLPGSSPAIGSKSTLIKQTFPPPSSATVPMPTFQSAHHVTHHQLQHPLHRSPALSYSHQQFSRMTPNSDTFHSLTVTNTNNGTSLLTTNNNINNNNNNTSSVLTNNNGDDSGGGGGGSGSGGHSLSQSMESINNIGLADDEVSEAKECNSFTSDKD